MSSRRTPAAPARSGPAGSTVDRDYVQGLLAEVRRLKVELERVNLETREVRERGHRPDPRLQRLQMENDRLRGELARARSDRDELEAGLREAVERLRRK